ncbi:MAG: hypothetical protein KAQ74_03665, partial [Dehalococcoidia bacterium]|nr:hypothetical protein [Dehalococcoidia bacterium]
QRQETVSLASLVLVGIATSVEPQTVWLHLSIALECNRLLSTRAAIFSRRGAELSVQVHTRASPSLPPLRPTQCHVPLSPLYSRMQRTAS